MKDVYLFKNELGRYKIGMSADPASRVKTLMFSGGVRVSVIKTWDCRDYASTFEEFLHALYNKFHEFGEWFSIPYNPETEIDKLHAELTRKANFCTTIGVDEWTINFKLAEQMRALLPEGCISHKRSKRIAEAAQRNIK